MVVFIVVPNNFQIPFSGILGSQLFLHQKAIFFFFLFMLTQVPTGTYTAKSKG